MRLTLPHFDIRAMDRRLLAELDRLRHAGCFATYRELAELLTIAPVTFQQIEAGRYHCSVRLLYLLASLYAEMDVEWVLLGQARTGRAEPAGWPVRERGRPASVKSA